MEITANNPSSVLRNIFLIGIYWVFCVIVLVCVQASISAMGASEAIALLVASGFIGKITMSILLISPLMAAFAWYFERRETFKKWVFTDESIQIYYKGILVRSVLFSDISRILFGQTRIGVFTRNPADYLLIQNLERDLCFQVQQQYRRREQDVHGNNH